jgi:hypothetical protein
MEAAGKVQLGTGKRLGKYLVWMTFTGRFKVLVHYIIGRQEE